MAYPRLLSFGDRKSDKSLEFKVPASLIQRMTVGGFVGDP